MDTNENIIPEKSFSADISADNFDISQYLPSGYTNSSTTPTVNNHNELANINNPAMTLTASSDIFSVFNNAFTPSADGSYNFSTLSAMTTGVNFSFTDLVTGYTFVQNNTDSSFYNYNISGYNNGNTSVQTKTISSGSYSSSYTASTFYNVGNRNGYLNGFNNNTGVMNFVDVNISSYKRTNDYVSFNMGNGTSFQAQTSSSENDIFQYTTDGTNISYAKIGYSDRDNSFEYVDGVHYLGSSEHTDVLNVNTYESKNIALDGSTGIIYDNINNINAAGSTGNNTLYGNAGNNEIRAGAGSNELWGGAGNDVLYGGGGAQDTYLYGVNEGSDVIYNSVATDKVDLYNVSLTDIVSANEVGQDLVIQMQGGESLTVVGQNGASNFVLSDRSAYNYNRQSHSWTKTA
ncbi:MAG: hypothetical protein IJU91_01135 [Selenomonadaceae bacterium]|nr:hypothetical protein [Selenomonadaceae bacterium]